MNFPSFRLACHRWDSEQWPVLGISSVLTCNRHI